jgi:hypothetical protein
MVRLWREKRGEGEPEDLPDNLIVQLGSVTEHLKRRWCKRNTGRVVTEVQRQVFHPVRRPRTPRPCLRCVETGETPRLFGVKLPRPQVEAVRIVDMSSSNSGRNLRASFARPAPAISTMTPPRPR